MIDNNYISILVEDYFDFKKGLGFELKICARRLRSFASYTRSLDYTGYISKDIALKWCCMGTDSSNTKGRSLEMLRPFLQFAHIKNENNEIIYNQIFPNVRKRPNPHIYTEEEVLILIEKYKELGYKSFIKEYSYNDYDFMKIDDKKLEATNEKEAKALIIDLYNRVKEITGEVESWEDVHATQGAQGMVVLNGTVKGKEGVAQVESILAGGYNIQRLHIRVLVKAL